MRAIHRHRPQQQQQQQQQQRQQERLARWKRARTRIEVVYDIKAKIV